MVQAKSMPSITVLPTAEATRATAQPALRERQPICHPITDPIQFFASVPPSAYSIRYQPNYQQFMPGMPPSKYFFPL